MLVMYTKLGRRVFFSCIAVTKKSANKNKQTKRKEKRPEKYKSFPFVHFNQVSVEFTR